MITLKNSKEMYNHRYKFGDTLIIVTSVSKEEIKATIISKKYRQDKYSKIKVLYLSNNNWIELRNFKEFKSEYGSSIHYYKKEFDFIKFLKII